VRAALYSGLSQVLSADPRCHELLSELLLPHLDRYVTPGDTLPPLVLDKCATIHQAGADPTLLEPLPALLSCVRRLAALQPGGEDGADGSEGGAAAAARAGLMDGSDASMWSVGMSSQVLVRAERGCESSQGLQKLLSGLRSRLLECDAEHFCMDRSVELSPASCVGQLNHVSGGVVNVGAWVVCVGVLCLDCSKGRASQQQFACNNHPPLPAHTPKSLQPQSPDARVKPAGCIRSGD